MSRAWMPLYVGDFLADTMHLNCQETGAYLRLLMHAWQHEGLIEDNNELMARIVRCHPPHWPRLRKVMEPFFDLTKTPGSWYSKRLGLELGKAEEISSKRKAAALQMHSKSPANGMQMHTQSQSQSHKEEDKKERERARGARLPPDWAISPIDWDFAKDLGWSADQITNEFDKFCDYWHAKTGQAATKTNWSATWRNWIRRAGENRRPNVQTRKDINREKWDSALAKLRKYAEAPADGELSGEIIQLLPNSGSGRS